MTALGVPTRQELESDFRSRLPAIADDLIATMQPSVRFRVVPEDPPPIGGSRFGGRPDLPAGWTWPHWEHPRAGQRPLWFFAQIDLAEASAMAPGPLGMPEAGLLSLFADLDDHLDGIVGLYSWEQPGSTIIYTPAEVELAPQEGPSHGPEARLAPVPAWTWRHDAIDFAPEEYDILDDIDNRYSQAIQGIDVKGFVNGGRHQLGGHESFVQHPAAEEVVQALAGCYEGEGPGHFSYERWEAAKSQVPDWRLVFQLDSEYALDVMWGDVGTLYWMARHEDIAAGRWNQCMFNFQSS